MIWLIIMEIRIGKASTKTRADITQTHSLLLLFSLKLAKNELFDVITHYIRLTDKYLLKGERQRLKEYGVYRGENCHDLRLVPTHGKDI